MGLPFNSSARSIAFFHYPRKKIESGKERERGQYRKFVRTVLHTIRNFPIRWNIVIDEGKHEISIKILSFDKRALTNFNFGYYFHIQGEAFKQKEKPNAFLLNHTYTHKMSPNCTAKKGNKEYMGNGKTTELVRVREWAMEKR